MTRKAARPGLVGLGAAAFTVIIAHPALAHGVGGRVDLPVPRSYFVVGAGLALVVSFVLLSALWKTPRMEAPRPGHPLPGSLQPLFRNRVIEWIIRLFFLALFLVVLVGALAGSRSRNIAPVLVFVWFWVGMAFISSLLGNWWATISPWDTLARLLGIEEGRRDWPAPLGRWPAVVGLFVFVWIELTQPFGPSARPLGIAIVIYSAVTLGGMALYGRTTWNENGEAFAAYLGILARIAPVSRDEGGRVEVRPPLSLLPSLEPRPGLVPLVAVMLGSTTFDGVTRMSAWTDLTQGMDSEFARVAIDTGALFLVILAVWGAYELAMIAAASMSGSPRRVLSVRFVHSLVPIALAYVVAHYFSLLLIEGQMGLSALSDPFGKGMDLFGTADWRVNLTLVSINTIWWVQVVAIVTGHIGSVILAHDRAVAMWEPKLAVRTQYAFLGVMVLFTAVGLLILSGG